MITTKKPLALLTLLLSLSTVLKANPVDMQTARQVAVKFINANTKTQLRGTQDLQLVTTYRTESNDAAFHVFNTPNGFVIVSADDCATPILGYSDEGRPFEIDNVPIQLQDYLQGFVEQIQYGIENEIKDESTMQQWELVKTTGRMVDTRSDDTTDKAIQKRAFRMRDGKMETVNDASIVRPTLPKSRTDNVVEPLITAQWDQGCYYNAMCPEDEAGDCGHVPTGCVATAMGMIMRYWGYPAQGTGTHSYTPDGYPEQSVNYCETIYDWDNMPDQLSETSSQAEIDAVSTLLWHCGVAVNMMYGYTSSGALDGYVPDAFQDYFGYCTPYFNFKTNDSEWLTDVKTSLDHGRPLLYYASDVAGQVAHAFVCDGYNIDDLLHFNWGWGGNGNGYYALDALNVGVYQFSEDIYALFGIMPQSEFQLCYNIVEGGAEVTHGPKNYSCPNLAYDSYPDTIVIPPAVNIGGIDYPVIAIGDSAFTCCENLKSIVLPNTIKTIGRRAFDANFSLTSVNFPNSLRTIKESAFIGALSLSEINLPDSIETLEPWCFAYTTFTEITIPRSLTTVGDGLCAYGWIETVYWNADSCGTQYYNGSALDGGTSLWGAPTTVVIGENVKHIPELCFYAVQCDSITIPDSVISIGTGAFIFCGNLKNVSMGKSLVDIGELAFYEDNSLTSITIPKHVRNIGMAAFANCDVLNTVYYNAIYCLDANQAFNWDPVTRVIFGDSVIHIPSGLFSNCLNLPSVTIPASVNGIGNNAFSGCENLQTVNMLPTIPPMVCEESFDRNAADRVFTVSCESYSNYYSDSIWSCYRSDLRGFDGTEQLLTLISNDSEQGNVVLFSVCDSIAFFYADAHHGYVFDHWSTGSTNNPNTHFLTEDTTIVAYFRLDHFNVTGTPAKKVFFTNFEDPTDDTTWFFKNDDYPNRWCINNLDSTNRALFISSDNGVTNSCTNTTSSVFAYTPISFSAGDYVYSYNWRDDGHDCYYPELGFFASGELMESGLIPYSLDSEIVDSYGWWMIGECGANYLRANHSGNNDWQIQQGDVNLWYDTIYYLVFYWRLDNPQIDSSNGYPAAVDNIVFGTLDYECGYVIGAENVDYLDTATITAVPNPGYRFVCWYDCDPNPVKEVVVTGDLNCIAYFEPISEGISQTINLLSGWNWISTYIESEDPVALLQMLESALGDNASQISSAELFTENDGGEWWGELDEVGLTNEQMYMILANTSCTIEFQGQAANPANHAITINPGWNWIGFPSDHEMSIEEALGGFDAEEGDVFANSEMFTEFEDGEWFGDVAILIPGQGFMYYSNSTEPKRLVIGGSKTRR